MIIENKSKASLFINDNEILPGETHTRSESIFNTVDIHSAIGSCEIITEYCKRHILNYGNLCAKESTRRKDDDGMKIIIVKEVK